MTALLLRHLYLYSGDLGGQSYRWYQTEEALSPEAAAGKHNAYYCDKEKSTYAAWYMPLDPKISPQRSEEMAEHLNDISHFMGVFQQRFAHYINSSDKLKLK